MAACTDNTCGYAPAAAGTVCRPAVNACDVAETCNGISTVCPADAKAPNNTFCTTDRRCCGGTCCALVGACESGHCPASCFVTGTRVAMVDGTSKPIELVETGDLVLGRGGSANRVVGVERPLLGGRRLYALNGGAFFVTAEHPFATPEGWKAVDPAATRAENPLLPVGRLDVGDRLLALAAVAVPVGAGGPAPGETAAVRLEPVPLRSVEGRAGDPATTLYNLLLDGDHTYFADELLVHNKGR